MPAEAVQGPGQAVAQASSNSITLECESPLASRFASSCGDNFPESRLERSAPAHSSIATMSGLFARTAACKGYVALRPMPRTPDTLGVFTPLKPAAAMKQRNLRMRSRFKASPLHPSPLNSKPGLLQLTSGLSKLISGLLPASDMRCCTESSALLSKMVTSSVFNNIGEPATSSSNDADADWSHASSASRPSTISMGSSLCAAQQLKAANILH
mmetsp:Transcript_68444/g.198488  ORF Transcript_68444/g.198488 Transcript_68444/m.198488 type:complete len:213 (-) Transcript_68444:91-729(-)